MLHIAESTSDGLLDILAECLDRGLLRSTKGSSSDKQNQSGMVESMVATMWGKVTRSSIGRSLHAPPIRAEASR